MKHKPETYRQGDVLIVRVNTIPREAKPVRCGRGRIILAYGEATGHAHAIAEEEVTAYEIDGVIRYLEVAATAPIQRDAWKCKSKNGETVYMPCYEDPAKLADQLTVLGRADVRGAILCHEEHAHFILTPNSYRHGGSEAQKAQREYTPTEIRNVAD